MYQWPISLPVFTNREDIIVTGSIADDFTGSFINLSGVSLAANMPFTGSSWTITDGAIITTSTTPITIPYYPIGNQLSALTLTVGTGLGILPGDFVLIADPTGLNTMTGYVTSYTSSNGALVVQVGWTFQFEVRRRGGVHQDIEGSGYTTWFDIGVEDDFGPLIQASLGNGILITDVGFYQILIPESQVKTLHADQTYWASLTMTNSVDTRQIFKATLPMLTGGVTN